MNAPSIKQRVYFDPHETQRLLELEGVKLASFRKRLLAMAIDLGLIVVFVILLVLSSSILSRFYDLVTGNAHSIPLTVQLNDYGKKPLIQLGVLLGYFGLATFLTNGRTLGKWAVGIRVLSTVHEKLNLFHSLERGLGYLASSLEFGFGFMQYFINPNHRCVHDRIAETIVVEEETIRQLKRIS